MIARFPRTEKAYKGAGIRYNHIEDEMAINYNNISKSGADEDGDQLFEDNDKDAESIDLYSSKYYIENLPLRPYQIRAIFNLEQNNFRGILNMATGTGKTWTAIGALYLLWSLLNNKGDNLLVIVAVPDRTLLHQWEDNLNQYFENVFLIDGEHYNLDIVNAILLRIIDHDDLLSFIIITQQSLKKLIYNRKINYVPNLALVADEVHMFGAKKTRELLSRIIPKYRIGLSATFKRYYDEEGTNFLKSYFGRVVFKISIEQAQKLNYLVNYKYQYEICELLDEEYERYMVLSRKIAKLNAKLDDRKDNKETEEELKNLMIKRSLILKKAYNKTLAFEMVLFKLKHNNIKDNIVVFLEDEEQNRAIKGVLNQFGYKFAEYNANTSYKERIEIIKKFKAGKIQMVLTKHCWDQGVDIPSLKAGIIISSTSNIKQFIQRLGRLLRVHPEKPFVYIFDIIVTKPGYMKQFLKDGKKIDKDSEYIFMTELYRMRFFKNNAINVAIFDD